MKAKTIIGILSLLLISSVSLGNDEITWASLTDSEQKVLAGFQSDWDALPVERRQRLVRGADRWTEMNAGQRLDAQARFADWRNLPNDRKDRIRLRYEEYRNLPAKEQRRIRDNYQRFNRMNHDRRERMRDRYRNMTPEQRQRARDRMRDRPRPTTRD